MKMLADQQITPQNEAEWHALRATDVTASVAGQLLGVSPYATPYHLWATKTGRMPIADNKAMRRGKLLEPIAVQLLREDQPTWSVNYTADSTYYRMTSRRVGATPDAFAMRPDKDGYGIVQIKTVEPSVFRREWINDENMIEAPLHVAVQAIVEAKLAGADWACAVPLVVGYGLDVEICDVPIVDGVWDRFLEAADEFWRMVEAGEHPDIDWLRDGAVIEHVYRTSTAERIELPSALAYNCIALNQARQNRRAAEADEAHHRAILLHGLKHAEAGTAGHFDIYAKTQWRDVNGRQVASRPIVIREKDRFNGSF